MVRIINLFGRRVAPAQAKQPAPRGPSSGEQAPPEDPATRLQSLLKGHKIVSSPFLSADVAYLVADAMPGEHLVQAWTTEDWLLKDVRWNGATLATDGAHAWFGVTSLRIAAGRVSKNWREQLATVSVRFSDVSYVSPERGLDGMWHLMVTTSEGTLDVALDPAVEEVVIKALADMVWGKGELLAA